MAARMRRIVSGTVLVAVSVVLLAGQSGAHVPLDPGTVSAVVEAGNNRVAIGTAWFTRVAVAGGGETLSVHFDVTTPVKDSGVCLSAVAFTGRVDCPGATYSPDALTGSHVVAVPAAAVGATLYVQLRMTTDNSNKAQGGNEAFAGWINPASGAYFGNVTLPAIAIVPTLPPTVPPTTVPPTTVPPTTVPPTTVPPTTVPPTTVPPTTVPPTTVPPTTVPPTTVPPTTVPPTTVPPTTVPDQAVTTTTEPVVDNSSSGGSSDVPAQVGLPAAPGPVVLDATFPAPETGSVAAPAPASGATLSPAPAGDATSRPGVSVLGVQHQRRLPRTGAPLGILALMGVGLVVIGTGLRRSARCSS